VINLLTVFGLEVTIFPSTLRTPFKKCRECSHLPYIKASALTKVLAWLNIHTLLKIFSQDSTFDLFLPLVVSSLFSHLQHFKTKLPGDRKTAK
jgi:hypothetical protein